VVVILPNADSADLAVVSSFGDGHLALKTIAFYCFLIAIDHKLCDILCLSIVYRWSFQQAQIEEQSDAEYDSFSNFAIEFSKFDDEIERYQIEEEGYEENDGYGAVSPLGLVFHLDVAVKFDQIDAGVLFIQHLCYCFVLVLFGDVDWQ
jgi:hypothetical protein